VNIFQNTISKLSIAMLALFSMALFMMPGADTAQAQTGRTRSICFNEQTGVATNLSQNGTCPNGAPKSVPLLPKGVCIVQLAPSSYVILDPSDDTGNYYFAGGKCYQEDPSVPGQAASSLSGTFVSFDSMPVATATTPNPPVKPKPGTKPVNSGAGTTINTGTPCNPAEEGFHQAGPLCVPNSPFGNSTIAGGGQTASSLAIRIIKILLYFAGIVAVIMIIIGGYRVMTAGANANQASDGRKTLTNAIIGLAIVILAYVIVQVVISFITK
jgi:hypothetical protein